MDARLLWKALRRYWWLVALTTLAAGALAFGGSSLLPNVYASSITLQFRPLKAGGTDAYGQLLSTDRVKNTYVRLVTTTPVLEKVSQDPGVGMSVDSLRNRIQVNSIADTELMTVTVEGDSARQARAAANALAAALIDEKQKDLESRNLTLEPAQPAEENPTPIRPQKTFNTLLGALFGLVGGMGVALVLASVDNKVQAVEQAQEASGLQVIGQVPKLGRLTPASRLIEQALDHGAAGEAFRLLQLNISMLAVMNPRRLLLVTSALPGEGKSTVAAGLALAAAQSGRRVILVDADFRRPRQHDTFGGGNRFGLSTVLLNRDPGGAPPATYIRQVYMPQEQDGGAPSGSANRLGLAVYTPSARGEPGLSLLSSGPLPANPAELLSSDLMRKLLHRLTQDYDLVVIDTSPILPVTDTSALAVHVDGVLLVARRGQTRYTNLKQAKEQLETVQAQILGLVLNDMPPQTSRYYSTYRKQVGLSSGSEPVANEARGMRTPRGYPA